MIAQLRCEQILRSKPESRTALEMHLACLEAKDQEDRQKLKEAAIGTAAVAVLGVAAGVASLMFAKR